jgi:glycosyltransferase involved in cell wall biosynthesis
MPNAPPGAGCPRRRRRPAAKREDEPREREAVYEGQRVSLVLPTYNERDSIRKVIQDFERLGIVDEILVINNNAAEGTSTEVEPTSAIEIHEPVQGYGRAIRRGFAEATGDLVVLCEPDDTFSARDLLKLLTYSADVDVVYGSRTVQPFIWEGANMGWFLRFGNWSVAKLVEVLFNTNSLSDVGCTFRLVSRRALDRLTPRFLSQASFFGLEMMILGYRLRVPSVQVPVNYRQRVGQSAVTGHFGKALRLGIQMILLVLGMRLGLHEKAVPFLERLG